MLDEVRVADTILVPIKVVGIGDHRPFNALADFGATGNVLNESVVKSLGLWKFCKPVKNVFGSSATASRMTVTHVIECKVLVELMKPVQVVFTAWVSPSVKLSCYLGLPFIKEFHKLIPFGDEKDNDRSGKEKIVEVQTL